MTREYYKRGMSRRENDRTTVRVGERGAANEKLPVRPRGDVRAPTHRNVLIYSRLFAGIMCHALCYSCRCNAKINVKHLVKHLDC